MARRGYGGGGGSSSGGGGGSSPSGPEQTGVITLTQGQSTYILVNIAAGNATVNLASITPFDRQKLAFLLVGESDTHSLTYSGATITALANGSTAQSSLVITGSGQATSLIWIATESKWYAE